MPAKLTSDRAVHVHVEVQVQVQEAHSVFRCNSDFRDRNQSMVSPMLSYPSANYKGFLPMPQIQPLLEACRFPEAGALAHMLQIQLSGPAAIQLL